MNIWKRKAAREDREIKILVSRCDMCNNRIPGAPEDVESQLDKLIYTVKIPTLILCDLSNRVSYSYMGF